MIATCSKCGKLFETTQEDAYTPGVTCAPCYNWGACVDAAVAHVNAGGGEDSPTYTALAGRVRLWLRSRSVPADDATVRAEADKFILATYAW